MNLRICFVGTLYLVASLHERGSCPYFDSCPVSVVFPISASLSVLLLALCSARASSLVKLLLLLRSRPPAITVASLCSARTSSLVDLQLLLRSLSLLLPLSLPTYYHVAKTLPKHFFALTVSVLKKLIFRNGRHVVYATKPNI